MRLCLVALFLGPLFSAPMACLGAEDRVGEDRVIDLTHELSEGIPHFPGGVPFRKEPVAEFEKDGYLSHRLELGEHTGTHLDAPVHFKKGAASVSELLPERLIGPGLRLSMVDKVAHDPDALLEEGDITRWEEIHGWIPQGSFLLIHTGWSSRWPSEAAYRNMDSQGVMHFPGLSQEAAQLLIQRRITSVGIDTLSIDPGTSTDFKAHRILAEAGVLVIENLGYLESLPESGFQVVVAPLKIRGGSGSPCRVLALFERFIEASLGDPS